jgi:hypothetical protein
MAVLRDLWPAFGVLNGPCRLGRLRLWLRLRRCRGGPQVSGHEAARSAHARSPGTSRSRSPRGYGAGRSRLGRLSGKKCVTRGKRARSGASGGRVPMPAS